jgi:hypothetical protein
MLVNITGSKKLIPGVDRLPPVYNYDASEQLIRRLINYRDWHVYQASTGLLINKNNVDNIIYGGPSGGGSGGSGGEGELSGGNDVLDEPITFTDTIGGISAGTVFPVGKTVESILKQLGNKLVLPKVSLTSNLGTLIHEAGTSISGGITLTAKVTKGSSDIKKVEFYRNDSLVSMITSNVANGGNFTYADSSSIMSDRNYKVIVTIYENNKSVSDSFDVKFYSPYYHGISKKILTDLTSADITSLTKEVTPKTSKNYKYTSNTDYCIFAYPKNYGKLSSILDDNGFENIDSWNISEIEINSVPYYIYQSKTSLICDNFTYKFIY